MDAHALAAELLPPSIAERTIPSFAVSAAFALIRSSVRSRAGFDINELAPIDHADTCRVPTLFGHGEQDDFIDPSHTAQLHAKHGGRKSLVTFEGDHNSERPDLFRLAAVNWLRAALLEGPLGDFEPEPEPEPEA